MSHPRVLLALLVASVGSPAHASLERTITSLTGFDQGVGGPVARVWMGDVRTLAIDAQGNVFYLERENNTIRRIDAVTGIVTAVAGNGFSGPADDASRPAVDAPLMGNAIAGGDAFTIDSRGILYIADGQASRVRAVNTNPPGTGEIVVCNVSVAPGAIETIAGTGAFEEGHDGDPAIETDIAFPVGIEVDAAFNVYFSEPFLGRVRKIDGGNGILGTFAGGLHWEGMPCDVAPLPALGDGGQADAADLCFPTSIAIDPAGRYFYIGEWPQIFSSDEAGRIRRVDLETGVISTFAGDGRQTSGGDGGAATAAGVSARPGNITFDDHGNVFFAESYGSVIRRVDTAGTINRVGGGRMTDRGTFYDAADLGRPALDAMMNWPDAVVYHGGRLYYADANSGNIRFIEPAPGDGLILGRPSEIVGELTGGAGLKSPWGQAFDEQGNLFVASAVDPRLRRVDRAGRVTTVVGKRRIIGKEGDCGGERRRERHPERCRAVDANVGNVSPAFDAHGDLYITDQMYNRVRKIFAERRGGRAEITAESTIDLVTETPFSVMGIAIHRKKIYLGETFGTQVVVYDQETETFSPVAGAPGAEGYDGDGGPATAATFRGIAGLAYDDKRDALYLADNGNHVVRKIDLASGVITTLATVPDLCPPWGCVVSALFIAFDGDDSLYLADDGNHIVFRFDLAATPVTVEIHAGMALHLTAGFNGDHQPATDAFLDVPSGLAVDPAGKLHLNENGTQRVRRVGLVDILPGAFPNVIRQNDTVEVAVLATYGFTPFTLDPSTLSVAAAPILLDDRGQPRVRYCDVDGDGRLDLVVKVRARDLGLGHDAREAAVVGATWTGGSFADADWVKMR